MNKTSNPLIELRQKQMLSRQDLSNILGVALLSIGRYERGERRPTADIIPNYAKALGCTADELLQALPKRKTSNK